MVGEEMKKRYEFTQVDLVENFMKEKGRLPASLFFYKMEDWMKRSYCLLQGLR